jgi:hypothetical protein
MSEPSLPRHVATTTSVLMAVREWSNSVLLLLKNVISISWVMQHIADHGLGDPLVG